MKWLISLLTRGNYMGWPFCLQRPQSTGKRQAQVHTYMCMYPFLCQFFTPMTSCCDPILLMRPWKGTPRTTVTEQLFHVSLFIYRVDEWKMYTMYLLRLTFHILISVSLFFPFSTHFIWAKMRIICWMVTIS